MAKWQPVRRYRKCVSYGSSHGQWYAILECGHGAPFNLKAPGYRPKRLLCRECIEVQIMAHQGLVEFSRNQVRRYGEGALA